MSLDDLQVYTKTYDYLHWVFPITMGFPKAQRFVLAQRIENTLLAMLELIIEGNASRDKFPYIQGALVKLQLVQVFMRFAKDQRFISVKRYETSSVKLVELGRLLGGWLRQATHVHLENKPHG